MLDLSLFFIADTGKTHLRLPYIRRTGGDGSASEVRSGYRNSSTHNHWLVREVDDTIPTADAKRDLKGGIKELGIDLNTSNPSDLLNRMVIVTAISENHLKESKGMIGSVQEFLPNTRIIMYDLGLSPHSIQEVLTI